ncbi:MAG: hypothetical protein ACJ77K_13935 [Bacteroidia bacterium]
MLKLKYLTIAAILGTAVISCNQEQDELAKAPVVDSTAAQIIVSSATIDGIINSIPSPLETTTLIKESGLAYDESYLNPSDNAEHYRNKYSKSLAIGVYSADLGYLNLYQKNFAAINYIIAVNKLAGDLQIEQFFDFETLKRLASSNDNLDSLLYISTDCFNKMDTYLRANKRSEQSSLIIIGAWLEGLSFETKMAANNPGKKIRESIGEQKVAMNNIIAILDAYHSIPFFENARKKMEPLKALFDQVNISYNYREPETKEVNGELVVVEKSESEVTISEDVFKNILKTTSEIRNSILETSN